MPQGPPGWSRGRAWRQRIVKAMSSFSGDELEPDPDVLSLVRQRKHTHGNTWLRMVKNIVMS